MTAVALRPRLARLTPVFFILGTSAIAVLGSPLQIRLPKADPSFYLSYVLDYGALAQRFGQTYHGNRLSYLLVDRTAFALFGPEAGYLASRWAFLSIAGLALWDLARGRLGNGAALLLSVTLTLTPWLPRQLLWVHYDGFSATYLLAAAWLLAGAGMTGRLRRVLAGFLLGLAVNANLVIAVIASGAAIAWAASVRAPARRRCIGLLEIGAGLVAAELLLSLALRILVGTGPWFVETVAIRVALFLVGDENDWFEPLGAVFEGNPLLAAVPVLVAIAALRAWAGARTAFGVVNGSPDLPRFGAVWLGFSSGAFLLLHLAIEWGGLSGDFYVVQLLPPILVALIAAVPGVVPNDPTWSLKALAPALAGVTVLGPLWVSGAAVKAAVAIAFVALAGLLFAGLAAGRLPVPAGRFAGVLASLVLAGVLGAPTQSFGGGGRDVLAAREAFEWDLFQHIREVQALVEAEVPPDRDLVFWHRTDGIEAERLRLINMAYYGTGEGRLHRDKGEIIGMPTLIDAQVEELRSRSPITVVLLGLERSEVTAGLVTLSTAVPGAQQITQTVLDGDIYDVHVALVEVG